MCSSDLLDFTVNGGGTYGSLTLDTETGAWTYTLNNSDSDTQALNAGQTAAETFTYTVNDEAGATASATLTITIRGANDTPTATDDEGGTVTEAGGVGNTTPGEPTATGTLANNVSDVDNAGTLPDDLDFTVVGGGTYGSLTLDTDTGDWTYTLNDADDDTQALNAGETAVETYTYTVTDEAGASATATLLITIVGANDAPTASQDEGGAVTEAGGLEPGVATATGSLADKVSDVDNDVTTTDDLDFTVAGDGTYGSLWLDTETGDWVYTLNNQDTDTDSLNAGESAVETYTYTAIDEAGATASATLSITIYGANDAPQAADAFGGPVSEAGGEANAALQSLGNTQLCDLVVGDRRPRAAQTAADHRDEVARAQRSGLEPGDELDEVFRAERALEFCERPEREAQRARAPADFRFDFSAMQVRHVALTAARRKARQRIRARGRT